MSVNMNRREFVSCALAAGASLAAGCDPKAMPSNAIDPNRVVLAADIHIPLPWSQQQYRTGREYPWIVNTVREYIAEIVALRPRPANFIILGDLSIAFGEEREYVILRELLQPLYDAGIKVTLAMGNHDIRASFAKAFPEAAVQSLVKGRYVYRVETPNADFILLDSLKEPTVRGRYEALLGCDLGDAQRTWAKEEFKHFKKPTFVGAHHPVKEIKLLQEVCAAPHIAGYFYGHHHRWCIDSVFNHYGNDAQTIRSTCIGAFAIDNYVGYAVMDIAPQQAVMNIVSKDYYFPVKRPAAERPALWDELARDYANRKVVFPFI